ncbi:MAG TPA: hypothetical protein VE377_14790 [Candidatus Dormibacteraeota bacterium]|nr:hypothetical protein [Candidatus Dormibacteraeota bacterium]
MIGSIMRTRYILALAALASTLGCTASARPAEDSGAAPLKQVADVPLPGPAVRFDYQSFDRTNGRLYIAHMNADQLVVFDVKNREVVANLDGFPNVHGVLAVPEINRVFASATGEHKLVIVDMQTLKILATPGPIKYPDGIAYAPAPSASSSPMSMATPTPSSTPPPTHLSPPSLSTAAPATPSTTPTLDTSSSPSTRRTSWSPSILPPPGSSDTIPCPDSTARTVSPLTSTPDSPSSPEKRTTNSPSSI